MLEGAGAIKDYRGRYLSRRASRSFQIGRIPEEAKGFPAGATLDLREELAGRIGQVVKAIAGQPDAGTVKVLEGLATKLKDQADWVSAYDAVRSAIHR